MIEVKHDKYKVPTEPGSNNKTTRKKNKGTKQEI